MIASIRSIVVGALAFGLLQHGVLAASSGKDAHTTASLIADVAMVKPGDSFRVGIRLQPDKGWHTYWRNPGDAGASPSVSWALPDGVTVGEIDWPTPGIFQMGPIVTYAYPGEVIHVATVTVPEDFADKQLVLKAELSWLACDEGNCVPGDAMLDISVPIAKRSIKKLAESAMMNRRQLPESVPADWDVKVKSKKDYLLLSVSTKSKLPATTKVLLAEQGIIEPGKAQKWGKRGSRYEVKLMRGPSEMQKSKPLNGLLLLEDNLVLAYEFEAEL